MIMRGKNLRIDLQGAPPPLFCSMQTSRQGRGVRSDGVILAVLVMQRRRQLPIISKRGKCYVNKIDLAPRLPSSVDRTHKSAHRILEHHVHLKE